MRVVLDDGFPQLSLPATPGKEDASGADGDNDRPRLPHAAKFKEKFKFERSGEPTAENENEADEPNPYLDADDHWTQQDRPPWQQHSALGPNVNPEGRLVHFSPLEAVVDPEDYNYSVNEHRVSLDHARAGWETLAATANAYSDTTLRRDALDDDFQQLFVDVVLKHVEALVATDARLPLKPLRLLLCGHRRHTQNHDRANDAARDPARFGTSGFARKLRARHGSDGLRCV